jgi:hypothetical protein
MFTNPSGRRPSPPGRRVCTSTYRGKSRVFPTTRVPNKDPELEQTLKSWVAGEHVALADAFSSTHCGRDPKVWMEGVGAAQCPGENGDLPGGGFNLSADNAPRPSTTETLPSLTNDLRTRPLRLQVRFFVALSHPTTGSSFRREGEPEQ